MSPHLCGGCVLLWNYQFFHVFGNWSSWFCRSKRSGNSFSVTSQVSVYLLPWVLPCHQSWDRCFSNNLPPALCSIFVIIDREHEQFGQKGCSSHRPHMHIFLSFFVFSFFVFSVNYECFLSRPSWTLSISVMNVQSYIAVCGLGHHRGNYKLIYAMRHMSSVSGLCLHATREILRGNIQAKLPKSRMLPQRGAGLLFVNIFEDRQCISREIASCLLLWRGEKGSACCTIPQLPVCSVFICLPLVRGQSGSLTFISHCNKDTKKWCAVTYRRLGRRLLLQ